MEITVKNLDAATPSPAPGGRRGLNRWWIALIPILAFAIAGYGFHRYQVARTIADCRQKCLDLKIEANWTELARISEKWSKLDPESADAWLYRSEAAEGLQDWKNLVQYLSRVPRNDHRAMGALVSKAMVEFEKLNRPWDGTKTCDEILAINPRILVAHKQTIFFYMMTLQRTEAIRRVRRAIRLRHESPESYVFLVGQSWLFPTSLYRNNNVWLESDPESEIFEVARAMPVYTTSAKDDPQQAEGVQHIPTAAEMLEKYPHNQELIAYLMNLAITDGDLERVETLLKAFPEQLIDSDARYWRAKAWCEDARGDFEQSEKSLKKAFSLDPYWWQIHYNLHDLMRRLGRMDEAAKFFKIYKISKDLSTEITNLNQSPENLDANKFCRELLVLAELIQDDEVIATLRERVGIR